MKNIPYDTTYFPPAPVVTVHLAIPDESTQLGPLTALIDTGADGTFVATSLLEELDAPIVYITNVRPHLGTHRQRAAVYKIDLLLAPTFRIPAVEVVGDDWGEGVIIGRNVLNKLNVLLNGRHQTTTITE
jgi:hypothetical protein